MEIAIRRGVFTANSMGFLRHLEGLLKYGELLTPKERKSVRRFMEQVMIPTALPGPVQALDQAVVGYLLYFDKPVAQSQTIEVKAKKKRKKK